MSFVAKPVYLSSAEADFDANFKARLHWSADTDAAIEARVAEILAVCLEEGMRTLKMDGIEKVLQGITDMPQVRVYGREPQALLGTAHSKAGELIPNRLLSPLEIQQILESTPAPALA